MTLPLNADLIADRSLAARQGMAIEVMASIPSTNTELRARIARLAGPMLLAAEMQTAGRGRAGRSWHAAPGDSLCFSIVWPFQGPVARLSGLSLMVGVVIAETLRSLGWPVQLKWPNDLLLGGAKLGGILIETAQRPAAPVLWAVIGIGLNVRPNAERDSALAQTAAALHSSSASADSVAIDRHHLLATLADALAVALTVFDREGLPPFVGRWQALHLHQHQAVRILEQDTVLHEGIARGIDDSGRLLLDTTNGRVAISAGDVSLRPVVSNAVSDGGAHAAAG